MIISGAVAHTGVANHDAIAAAKGAVAGLTIGASATYAPHKIRINCIAPGLVSFNCVSSNQMAKGLRMPCNEPPGATLISARICCGLRCVPPS